MLIGELARRSGLSRDTLRYYENLGLLDPVTRRGNNYREYGSESLDRLEIIRKGKSIGLTLAEIAGVFHEGRIDRTGLFRLLQAKKELLDAQILALTNMRAELMAAMDRCPGQCGDPRPGGPEHCGAL